MYRQFYGVDETSIAVQYSINYLYNDAIVQLRMLLYTRSAYELIPSSKISCRFNISFIVKWKISFKMKLSAISCFRV